ncbi:hypothetical protein LRS10_09425 [Phenylobacterium sp. J426]|uniref:hypothetical protein n=1 Tax=Phenylobacterium sp. J426 TaxID=2898439 RepID=UPI0021508673|nr:hypothetical protein [Phenylobacterium sp. J426]MCR5874363.1 hypothetical protein [Phenylobacterium sp. J426]
MPANPETGVVSFEASGEAYRLQFSIDAICTLEDLLDKSVAEIGVQMARGRIGAIRASLWAGLREHHPKLPLKDAGELLKDPALKGGKATEYIGQALKLAFGDGDGGASDAGDDAPQA